MTKTLIRQRLAELLGVTADRLTLEVVQHGSTFVISVAIDGRDLNSHEERICLQYIKATCGELIKSWHVVQAKA